MLHAPPPPSLDLAELRALSVLGRGAKGVVFLVQPTAGGEPLALKAISRSSVEHAKSHGGGGGDGGGDAYRRIWFERDVLQALRHPLLPSLRGVVSTERIVGFAIDRCSGGDLNSLRRRQTEKMFSDDVIRFYAAELVLALEHLHGLGIVYRDLKPENVLIQDNGHLMLVDFDLSTKLPSPPPPPDRSKPPPPPPPLPSSASTEEKDKKNKKKKKRPLLSCFSCDAGVSPEDPSPSPSSSPSPAVAGEASGGGASPARSPGKSNSFVGTEDYVAPEIIRGKGHDFAVDWWGLGVVLYEMLYGRTPFRGQNRKETFYRILSKDPELVGEQTPLRHLIARLLDKDPRNRIAPHAIKQHEFFRGVDWESLLTVARPPFIPTVTVTVTERDGECDAALDVERVVDEVFQSREAAKGGKTDEDDNNGDGITLLTEPPPPPPPQIDDDFKVF
ncbi:serine/threonine-protein kinase OXI1-like [Ananas comosus]|uniref:non-specific serine/threonine protein kinase n=1 Tax=Ananas comosus TaxID=4615 RepID=A0A6P5GGB8_ANACO|nr:serine/threonine-protein kinase OXI1-like [Ananas comosus]